MNEVKFTIYGEPKGKGRPRVSLRRYKGKDREEHAFSKAYTPKDTVTYENLVKTEYSVQCGDFIFPDGAMLDCRIIAYYGMPKSTSKKKESLCWRERSDRLKNQTLTIWQRSYATA